MAKKTNIVFIFLILAVILFLLIAPNILNKNSAKTPLALKEETGKEAAEEEYVPISESDLTLDTTYYGQYAGQKKEVIVYNWGEYISDGSDDMLDINKAFENATGIKVNYSTFATNEELYAKLKSGNDAYDVIIPSDYMISKMISEDMLTILNFDVLPNYKHISEQFQSPAYDEGGIHSVPYTWGTTGIVYNTTMVDAADDIESWSILWNEKYLGEILMFSNSRDAFAVAEKLLNYSLNTNNPDELEKAYEALKNQKPLVQAYVMDEIFDKMQSGEAALAPYYAGDAVTMIDGNPDLDFVSPKEGVNIFVDAAAIPHSAPNPEIAHIYLNFLMEPQISAVNSEYIGYGSPNETAKEYMNSEYINNPIIYPSDEVLSNAEELRELPRDSGVLMDEYWTQLLAEDEGYNRMVVPIFLFISVLASLTINIYRNFSKKKKQYYF